MTTGEAAGRGLVEALLRAGNLPGKILIGGSRLRPVLQPLCDELGIQLWPASSLPALEEVTASLSQHLLARAPE